MLASDFCCVVGLLWALSFMFVRDDEGKYSGGEMILGKILVAIGATMIFISMYGISWALGLAIRTFL